MKLEIKIVPHNSPEYWDTVALRDKILRKPLKMVFTKAQLAAEHNQHHIAGYHNDKVLACLILVEVAGKEGVKMRQVAVDNHYQKQGLGQQMTNFCEQWCLENNYHRLYCHARAVAAPFYEKIGYQIIGEEFEEVGMKHWFMEKHF